MNIRFKKMDGAGNDFVVVDNRDGHIDLHPELVAQLCHRRYGVGADGLMALCAAEHGESDFRMEYYNSDGLPGTMCGNGGRCIATFAHTLGMGRDLRFEACDGMHTAHILEWDGKRGVVRLAMRDVEKSEIWRAEGGTFIDTGSPHFVLPVCDLQHTDVVNDGRRWRNRQDLFAHGANIDFAERDADGAMRMRTYERGVEDETLACGTGVTAVALVTGSHTICTRDAEFAVDYTELGDRFVDVWLTGPVAANFEGEWKV